MISFKASTQTPWTSEVQHEGVLTISCTLWTNSCEASTQVAFLAHERPAMVDASVAAVCLQDHEPKGFYGYQSLVDGNDKDNALRDLAGVTTLVFMTLLSLVPKVNMEPMQKFIYYRMEP